MSDLHASFQQGANEARALGFHVIYAKPNILLLDLDSQEAYDIFYGLWMGGFVPNAIEAVDFKVIPSKSGYPNRHVRIKLNRKYTVLERVAMQLMFGSDPKKERLTVVRYLESIGEPIRLFCTRPFDPEPEPEPSKDLVF